jgi:hypothetical protein
VNGGTVSPFAARLGAHPPDRRLAPQSASAQRALPSSACTGAQRGELHFSCVPDLDRQRYPPYTVKLDARRDDCNSRHANARALSARNSGCNNLAPIPSGSYSAFLRPDHIPNRIELRNVEGYSNIQNRAGASDASV